MRANPEVGVGLVDHVQYRRDFVGHLVGTAEDMPVVKLDRPHPGQAPQHSGCLGPKHRTQLGDAHGQLTIAVPSGPIDQRTVRAQARPQHQVVTAHSHRREHVLAVVRPVPGELEELPLGQHRRINVLVAGEPRASRTYCSIAWRMAAPAGSQYGNPASINGSESNRSSSRPSLRCRALSSSFLGRRRRTTRQQSPGAFTPASLPPQANLGEHEQARWLEA